MASKVMLCAIVISYAVPAASLKMINDSPSVGTPTTNVECSNGYQNCFDVDKCASAAPKSGKFAFVITHTLEGKRLKLPEGNINAMRQQAEQHSIDVILIVPKHAPFSLEADEKRDLAKQNISVMEVPWSVPPKAKFYPTTPWCGPKDFIRLHAFNLIQYDAVAYYDTDIELQGDVTPVLRCAAAGHFLSASGALAPLNLGFFAVKPSRALMNAALAFSETADFNLQDGWDNATWAPSHGKYPGAEGGQGFLYTLLYSKKSPLAQKALQQNNVSLAAHQIDRCVWNYQNECPNKNFDCSQVRAHHKTAGWARNSSEFCFKRGERRDRT